MPEKSSHWIVLEIGQTSQVHMTAWARNRAFSVGFSDNGIDPPPKKK